MTNDNEKNSIPEKAARRQAELLPGLLKLGTQTVLEKGLAADNVLGRFFSERRFLGSRDRRFLSEAFFSCFRWLGWTRLTTDRLEAAAVLAWSLDHTEAHPAIEILHREASLPTLPPLAGLSLEQKAEALTVLFGKPLAPEQLVPEWTRAALNLDEAGFRLFLNTIQSRPPVWLRIRPGKREQVLAALRELEFEHQPHPDLLHAVALPGGTTLNRLEAAVGRSYEVQDIASQAVGLLCAPQPSEQWLDACAGAGGKSLHLADLLQQQGRINATDLRGEPLNELKKRARRNGVRCIETQQRDAGKTDWRGLLWDGVLVDAPCSGLGTWNRNPDMRWRTEADTMKSKSQLQLKLLDNAARAVQPGGRLLYSVCTLSHAETETVQQRFMEKHPEFTVEPLIHPLTGQTAESVTIHPWDGPGGGMFIAAFRKGR